MHNIHKNGPQRKGVEREMLSALDSGSPISKIDFALDARRRGLRVYPMAPNSTEPAFPEADCFATHDEVQVKDWWKEYPDRNIGIATDNLLVLRIKTASAATALGDLFRSHRETTKTARIILDCAGREQENYIPFLVPKGVNVQARSNIAPGVDVLAFDGVIPGPGSVLNGTNCVFANENPAAPAPLWLMEVCGVQLPAESKTMNVVALKKPVSVAPTSAPIKTKLDWALEAAQYIPVHPLRRYVDPGQNASQQQREAAVTAAKSPLLNDWPNLATQDPEQIRKWWTQWPDANIGGATNNLIVVDIDPRKDGDKTLEFLQIVNDFPETAMTNTQGGGQHLLYVAPDGNPVKGGNDKLGQGIDIKAHGGYVLMPGSTIDGRPYTRANNRPIAFAPLWIVEACKVAKAKPDVAGKRIAPDDDAARDAAEEWLSKHAPRAELGERNNVAYKVAARCGDFGCGYDTRLDLVLGWNETHCEPPLDIEDLQVVCASAGINRENPIGKLHPEASLGFEADEIDESKAPPLAPRDTGTAENETAREPLPDLIKSSGEFVRGFVPPEYLIDGVLQRRFCYSMTASTGVGKTAIAMLLSAHVEAGRALDGLEVAKGSVLYFAGENPTDIQMRWLGLTQEAKADPDTANVHFVPGVVPLSKVAGRIATEVLAKGLRPALVVVDTSAAYFEGDDENSNTQAVEHARRMRSLTELPGGPCVLILCHPTKRANDDDMIPRGGGAFLAEVDGNIALHKRDGVIVASAQGKFRGPEFQPLSFALKTVKHPILKDVKGRSIPTVVARTINDAEKQRLETASLGAENSLLKAIHDRPDASMRDLAEAMGWRYKTGKPDHSKVDRRADKLVRDKLLRKEGRGWKLTPAGEAEIARLGTGFEAQDDCRIDATDASDIGPKTGK